MFLYFGLLHFLLHELTLFILTCLLGGKPFTDLHEKPTPLVLRTNTTVKKFPSDSPRATYINSSFLPPGPRTHTEGRNGESRCRRRLRRHRPTRTRDRGLVRSPGPGPPGAPQRKSTVGPPPSPSPGFQWPSTSSLSLHPTLALATHTKLSLYSSPMVCMLPGQPQSAETQPAGCFCK